MRTVLIATAAALAVMAAAGAQSQESFFHKRYCTVAGGNASGGLDCSYNTLEQCRMSASASTKYCAENPNWKPEASVTKRRAAGRE